MEVGCFGDIEDLIRCVAAFLHLYNAWGIFGCCIGSIHLCCLPASEAISHEEIMHPALKCFDDLKVVTAHLEGNDVMKKFLVIQVIMVYVTSFPGFFRQTMYIFRHTMYSSNNFSVYEQIVLCIILADWKAMASHVARQSQMFWSCA